VTLSQHRAEHIRQLAILLYQVYVETESIALEGTPEWRDLSDLTRQRWVDMATVLWSRLESRGIGVSGCFGASDRTDRIKHALPVSDPPGRDERIGDRVERRQRQPVGVKRQNRRTGPVRFARRPH
jgi:hypothetical protein